MHDITSISLKNLAFLLMSSGVQYSFDFLCSEQAGLADLNAVLKRVLKEEKNLLNQNGEIACYGFSRGMKQISVSF